MDHRETLKPLDYPWAWIASDMQDKMHWIPQEVPLEDDQNDWKFVLTPQEKNLLTQLFRFFTQADVDIAAGYIDKYMQTFRAPEIRMMLGTFVGMEVIHVKAYSLLLDTIGMPEIEYKAFQEYEEMKAKHEYLKATVMSTPAEIARTLAIYSGFGEGLQLFSSFAILMNFPRFGKMKGMGQIVAYSQKDETHHVECLIKLFHTLLDEHPRIWTNSLKADIYRACEDMVGLENGFIDLAFEQGGIEGLDKYEIREYIKYIADRRLIQLGLKPIYGAKTHPLEWLDGLLNAPEQGNFFEVRATEYGKGNLTGSWAEVWDVYKVKNNTREAT